MTITSDRVASSADSGNASNVRALLQLPGLCGFDASFNPITRIYLRSAVEAINNTGPGWTSKFNVNPATAFDNRRIRLHSSLDLTGPAPHNPPQL